MLHVCEKDKGAFAEVEKILAGRSRGFIKNIQPVQIDILFGVFLIIQFPKRNFKCIFWLQFIIFHVIVQTITKHYPFRKRRRWWRVFQLLLSHPSWIWWLPHRLLGIQSSWHIQIKKHRNRPNSRVDSQALLVLFDKCRKEEKAFGSYCKSKRKATQIVKIAVRQTILRNWRNHWHLRRFPRIRAII